MNRLTAKKRTQILGMLVEGGSLRTTTRLADVSINTVTKLLVDAGQACLKYQDETLRNLTSKRIQCDEIWSFVGAKEKNERAEKKAEGWGDIWTWVAIDPDTKLVPSFMVGSRGAGTAKLFMDDLAARLANRVQLTTDGNRVYLNAVEEAFGSNVDYTMLVKIYGNDSEAETRYSPSERFGCETGGITGRPKRERISTGHVERQNLTMRMGMRRFTRLTNGLSKKADNYASMIAIHFMHYNFSRIHKTLRITPAMAAGLADHVWSMEELILLLEVDDAK